LLKEALLKEVRFCLRCFAERSFAERSMVLLKEVHVAGPAQLCIFYRYIYRLASN
jgi:hypothetical protein